MSSNNSNRRTKHNLTRDDIETCAEWIVEAVSRSYGCSSVYLDWRGDIRVIQDASVKQTHRPDAERLGRYRKGIMVEQVEDDLLEWQRSLSAIAA